MLQKLYLVKLWTPQCQVTILFHRHRYQQQSMPMPTRTMTRTTTSKRRSKSTSPSSLPDGPKPESKDGRIALRNRTRTTTVSTPRANARRTAAGRRKSTSNSWTRWRSFRTAKPTTSGARSPSPSRRRVGYQCSNYYRSLVKNGVVQDENYMLDDKGELRFNFKNKGFDRTTIGTKPAKVKPPPKPKKPKMRPPPKIKAPKMKKPKKEPKKKKKDQGDDDTKGDKTFRCSVKTGEIRRSSRNSGKEKRKYSDCGEGEDNEDEDNEDDEGRRRRRPAGLADWILGPNHAHANRGTGGNLAVRSRRWLRNLVPNPTQPRSAGHVPVHQTKSETSPTRQVDAREHRGVFG